MGLGILYTLVVCFIINLLVHFIAFSLLDVLAR